MADKQQMPLRVLMTADTMGGVWTYALELIKALEPVGIEVALATMGDNLSVRQREQVAALPRVKLFESNFKLEWMDDPWQDVAEAGEWLQAICAAYNPDLIHLNNFCHGNLQWNKPVVMVVHSCVASWWKAVKGEAAPAAWKYYQNRVAAGLKAADWVVAPSAAMLEEARELYGNFKQSRVIYNGRDTADFISGSKEPIIFSMGRVWDEAKNIQLLAQVGSDIEWPVYIAGEARHPVTGKTLELPNVHFLGFLSETEIRNWLSRASIFALPVKYEPFGLAILEAALAGCALVVGDIPSQREIWGPAATYVNPQSPETLQAALQELAEDADTRNILGLRAQQRARQYNLKKTARAYQQVYSQLLNLTKIPKTKKKILI